MPDQHAFLSPSSAERWYHCPPSAWLCEQFPDQGNVFAAEGTEAHRLCEYLLHVELGIPDVDPRPGFEYWTEEMEEAAQGYVQFIREKLEKWKAENDKRDTVWKVETAGEIVENLVEIVNTRSIPAGFPQSRCGKLRNARKYRAVFQHFIQQLLKS